MGWSAHRNLVKQIIFNLGEVYSLWFRFDFFLGSKDMQKTNITTHIKNIHISYNILKRFQSVRICPYGIYVQNDHSKQDPPPPPYIFLCSNRGKIREYFCRSLNQILFRSKILYCYIIGHDLTSLKIFYKPSPP